ncbi:MAG TPA: response regulator [Nitrospira sp.]|nr:response regulator [Nitrospira sp.]
MDQARVLIIDDQPIPLETAASMLRLKCPGVRVEAIDSNFAALARIRTTDYPAVLCDAHQPRLDGIGFVRALRKIRPDLPVLLLFEKPDEDLSRQSMTAGAYDVLVHPVGETALLFAVRRAMEAARLRRQVQREREALVGGMRSMLKDLESLYGAYGLQTHFEVFLSEGDAERLRISPPRAV